VCRVGGKRREVLACSEAVAVLDLDLRSLLHQVINIVRLTYECLGFEASMSDLRWLVLLFNLLQL
jgi:hypothetical protein